MLVRFTNERKLLKSTRRLYLMCCFLVNGGDRREIFTPLAFGERPLRLVDHNSFEGSG
jgi:hypothetical protein